MHFARSRQAEVTYTFSQLRKISMYVNINSTLINIFKVYINKVFIFLDINNFLILCTVLTEVW